MIFILNESILYLSILTNDVQCSEALIRIQRLAEYLLSLF